MAATRLRAFAALSVSTLALTAACEPADDDTAGNGGHFTGGFAGAAGGAGSASPRAGAGSGGVASAGGRGKAGSVGVAGKGGSGSAGKGGAGPAGGSAGKWGFGGNHAGSSGAGRAGSTTTGSGGGAALPESGCGASSWPAARVVKLWVGAVEREFMLHVPSDYDSSRAYPVIFSWHGLGGSMGSFYQLNSASRAGSAAIHVSPQGLDNAEGDGAGWWNTDGADLAFVDALLEWTQGYFCVDEERVFSVGFSIGAMFSHLLGCERGDRFRAIAPIAGSFSDYYGFGEPPDCAEPMPMLGIHGTADDRVSLTDGEAARDVWVAKNACSATTEPGKLAGCVSYQGCSAGYPVTWCTHDGAHVVPSFAADAIWQFFSEF